MSKPADLLLLARDQARGKSEAHWRNAIGRAYYAAFHALTVWHAALPMPGDAGTAKGEHEQLIQRLCHPSKQCSADQRRTSLWLSGQLSALRALRVVADYKLDEPITLDNATLACALAGQILDKV